MSARFIASVRKSSGVFPFGSTNTTSTPALMRCPMYPARSLVSPALRLASTEASGSVAVAPVPITVSPPRRC
ncbi:Uncharacterised protein [Mycobacteroides abscessus subsp. abscessus]|nr:Uncharacterised protein [Mycobacteroides abscessus subsp. abscessus]